LFISAFISIRNIVREDVESEIVLRNRDTDWNVSVALSGIFLGLTLIALAIFVCVMIKSKSKYLKVTKFIRGFVIGMGEKRFRSVLFYYVWFISLWILIAVVIALIGIMSNIVCAIIFLILVFCSFVVHSIRWYFNSWFWHFANWLLELSLVVLGAMTVYEEAEGTDDSMGKGFVIFFTII